MGTGTGRGREKPENIMFQYITNEQLNGFDSYKYSCKGNWSYFSKIFKNRTSMYDNIPKHIELNLTLTFRVEPKNILFLSKLSVIKL